MAKTGCGVVLIALSCLCILNFQMSGLEVWGEPGRKPMHETGKRDAFSDLSGKIVFQSNRDGDEEIYTMNPKGEELVQLTSNKASDGYPVWSWDGIRIAFESNRDGSFQIYTMDREGKSQVKITGGPFENRYPAWSPDGKAIAYQSKRKGREQIVVMELEHKKEKTLTDAWFKCGLPNWSPDGKTIAFTANKLLGWGVYIMQKDGSNIVALDTEGGSCRPKWSKDGTMIAYVSQKADKKGDIWIMGRGGSGKKRLTTDSDNFDYYPSWSSDGNWIVYANTSHKEKGNWEIRIINVASGESRQITNHPAQDVFPDWR
jgi:Tol biopolymer transport system component